MGFRHTPFYNLLDTLRRTGCPFCRIATGAGQRYLETTFYEFVNDPSVRRQVASARGFCREHTRLVRRLGDPLGVALLHETLLDELIKADERDLFAMPKEDCPACRYVAQSLATSMGTFLDNFDEPEIQEYLQQAPTICFPHYQQLAQLAMGRKNKEVRRVLASIVRARLESLHQRVRAFAEAQNATLEHEQSSSAKDPVWAECLDFFTGTDISDVAQP
jgi:cytochrome c556